MFAIHPCMEKQWKSNLRRAMERKGMNMATLSSKLGRNAHYITQMLNRTHTPSVKTLKPIADILEVSVSELIDGSEPDPAELSPGPELLRQMSDGEGRVKDFEIFMRAYEEAKKLDEARPEGRAPRINFADMLWYLYEKYEKEEK